MENNLIRMFENNPMMAREFVEIHESFPFWFRWWIAFRANIRILKLNS